MSWSIDDGSPDGTADIVKRLMSEFNGRLLLKNGKKVRFGTALHSRLQVVAEPWLRIYFLKWIATSHNPDDLVRLYEVLRKEGADMSIGSRYIRGANG